MQTPGEFLRSFIPRFVDDRVLLWFYDLIRWVRLPLQTADSARLEQNRAAYLQHLPSIRKAGGYVEDQQNYGDMTYGRTLLKDTGCEILAVYNALNTLDSSSCPSLPDMILDFEADGMVLSGRFGTSPRALLRYLIKKGYCAELITDSSCFDTLGQRYSSLILTLYNNREDITEEIHTIHISRSPQGFTAHNASSQGPVPTVSQLIRMQNHGKGRGICLIGINTRD
ncbi:MAG: hypothetical protein Q4B85_06385 [Lachnospiraceae bacterium]|nr:hypothetical protein [Lachnospiraceae bacterium]